MKFSISCLFIVLIYSNLYAQEKPAQENSDSIQLVEYQKFMYRLIGFDISSPIGSFVFEATENPALKLNGVFRSRKDKENSFKTKLYYGGFAGVLTSKNKYTPVISKDKWVPDASMGINNYFFLWKSFKFYTDEIKAFAAKTGQNYISVDDKKNDPTKIPTVNKMSISDASSIKLLWLSNYMGYNYAQLNVLNSTVSTSTDTVFTVYRNNSFVGSLGLNYFWYPSKKSWLSFLGNVGYTYKTNDNNFNNLTDVAARSFTTYINGTSNIDIYGDEVKGKKGDFRIGNTNNLMTSLSVIISPSSTLYIGVTFYNQRTVASNFKYTDRGFSLNVPVIRKDKDKTVANFALKFDYPDIYGEIDAAKTMKQKRRVGFLVSLPLMPSPKQK